MGILDLTPLVATETRKLPAEKSAIYLLWRDQLPIHAGCVTEITQNLRERMTGHVLADGQGSPGGAIHFSYEVTDRPLSRLEELTGALGPRTFAGSGIRGYEEAQWRAVLNDDPEKTLPPHFNKASRPARRG